MPSWTIYCDSFSDELLAQLWLMDGVLTDAQVVRLPPLASAPAFLEPLLSWERLDWIVAKDDVVVCAVELSRHGYTGDNTFQRFARIFRASQLGIPVVYFTSFSRARLNEIDEGHINHRNVSPELFQVMDRLSAAVGEPVLAVHWPTGVDGTPVALTTDEAIPALRDLSDLVKYFCAEHAGGGNAQLPPKFTHVVEAMGIQAALPLRGSETRGTVQSPFDLSSSDWIWDWLPQTYFSHGKADKALASLALRAQIDRALVGFEHEHQFWTGSGDVQVLFLGYQWRPDPASGLIALSAAAAEVAHRPLVVVWPRIFLNNGNPRQSMLEALHEFKTNGHGPLRDELGNLGLAAEKVETFRERLSVQVNQYGMFAPGSKIGRILSDTADAVVLGDAVYRP